MSVILYVGSGYQTTYAYALTYYKCDVMEAPMSIGRCKVSAHALRHGGSMGAYGTSQGGEAFVGG